MASPFFLAATADLETHVSPGDYSFHWLILPYELHSHPIEAIRTLDEIPLRQYAKHSVDDEKSLVHHRIEYSRGKKLSGHGGPAKPSWRPEEVNEIVHRAVDRRCENSNKHTIKALRKGEGQEA